MRLPVPWLMPVLPVRPVLLPGPCVRPILPVLLPGPCVRPVLPVRLPGPCVKPVLPVGPWPVPILLPGPWPVLPAGTPADEPVPGLVGCATLRAGETGCAMVRVGLVGCATFRVGETGCARVRVGLVGCAMVRVGVVGRVTLRVGVVGRATLRVGATGRATLRTGAAGRATVRAGAARTGAATCFFCCWAENVAVAPASFDAGAVCANACGDAWAATATANAAINMLMEFRIDAPFFCSFFRRARCASANGETRLVRLDVYTNFIS